MSPKPPRVTTAQPHELRDVPRRFRAPTVAAARRKSRRINAPVYVPSSAKRVEPPGPHLRRLVETIRTATAQTPEGERASREAGQRRREGIRAETPSYADAAEAQEAQEAGLPRGVVRASGPIGKATEYGVAGTIPAARLAKAIKLVRARRLAGESTPAAAMRLGKAARPRRRPGPRRRLSSAEVRTRLRRRQRELLAPRTLLSRVGGIPRLEPYEQPLLGLFVASRARRYQPDRFKRD